VARSQKNQLKTVTDQLNEECIRINALARR
jgi:hypothetical protein